MPIFNDSKGSVMIAVVITVLSLTLMVGGIARWSVSPESRAIEEDLLTINQYWACVAAWEQFKGRALNTYKWNFGNYDNAGNAWKKSFSTPDPLTYNGDMVTFTIGTTNVPDEEPDETCADDPTMCEGNVPDKKTFTWNGVAANGGEIVIFPKLGLDATGTEVFGDYQTRWRDQVDNVPANNLKLTVAFQVTTSGDPNYDINTITVTSWRYGI